ncbi:glucosamine inositolphosphorylceramide transferase family protein [Halocatena marina]|uniref:glucosamine inositolphosphorylceramide transferase family protein n=1 Tax=Halocatena marina TaxID=2934937 RepID=UPI00200CE760|nr:hypothetical protein [Halocatena marina]
MDWTRRRFLLSTSLIAAMTGCQQLESDSPSTASHRSTDSSPSATTQSSPEPERQSTATQSQSPTTETQSAEVPARSETDTPADSPARSETDTPTDSESTDTQSSAESESETKEALYVGETIPTMPHAPHGATLPTGTNFHPSDATPVLRASDVTDYGAVDYVADPFMFVEEGTWHMFFEIVNENRRPDAPIGHATSSDGLHWTYNQVVLTKRYHTSFPLVWKYQNEYYMCPPTGKKVELYKAQRFPTDWTHIGNAIDVEYYSHDPTFVRYKGRWWLFTERGNENVMVYHSTDLEREGWIPHEGNPVVTDRLQAGRQGGRPIVVDDRLFLYFQDSVENYGDRIRCYEVTDLSPSTYADQEVSGSPVLHEFGSDWANDGMHTFDPWWLGPGKGWRCAVDGVRAQESSEDLWTIGIVDIPPST